MTRKNIIAIIILILLAVAGVWYFNNQKPKQNATENAEIKNETVSQSSLLTVINNNVQVKTKEESELKEVLDKTLTVYAGTAVKTSLTGRAVVEAEDGTTTAIDKNSEFTIEESGENKSVIYLAAGSLWAKVQKVFGQGEGYEIKTDNAVIAVRGTSFGVTYKDNKTLVWVHEGTVSLISIDPVTKKQLGKELKVEAGEKGTVATSNEPLHQALSTTDKRNDWYLFNTGTKAPAAPKSTDKPATTTNPNPPVQVANQNPPPSGGGAALTNAPPASGGGGTSSGGGGGGGSNTPPPAAPVESKIISVEPKVLYIGNNMLSFSINGQGLTRAVNVLVDNGFLQFTAEPNVIKTSAYNDIQPGTYDVVVIFPEGKQTLNRALTVYK